MPQEFKGLVFGMKISGSLIPPFPLFAQFSIKFKLISKQLPTQIFILFGIQTVVQFLKNSGKYIFKKVLLFLLRFILLTSLLSRPFVLDLTFVPFKFGAKFFTGEIVCTVFSITFATFLLTTKSKLFVFELFLVA